MRLIVPRFLGQRLRGQVRTGLKCRVTNFLSPIHDVVDVKLFTRAGGEIGRRTRFRS